jgi:hypothetical protein
MTKRSKTESKVKVMFRSDQVSNQETIGLDLGDRYSHFGCVALVSLFSSKRLDPVSLVRTFGHLCGDATGTIAC